MIKASREAFWKADKKLNSFYEHVERGFGPDLEFSLAQYASHTSGDDALFVFDDALEFLKKREKSLIKNGGPFMRSLRPLESPLKNTRPNGKNIEKADSTIILKGSPRIPRPVG